MPRPSQRDRVLAAATELVAREGATALTLDAAAAGAGVSKGGLLYHFPTKAALIEGMIEAGLDRFETVVEERAAADSRPASWARAYVDTTFDLDVAAPYVATTLLTPEVDGTVLERCAIRFATWAERISDDGLSPSTAALVRFAADGWWTYAAVGTSFSTTTDHGLRDRLHALIDAEVAS